MENIFNVDKFNLISDNENYYFFRALEPWDIEEIKNNKADGGLRTDRKRWEETHKSEKPRWNSESEITLVYCKYSVSFV